MRFYLLVLILILSISCSTGKTLVGVYGDKKPHDNYQCDQVQFRKDSTYEMYFNIHMYNKHAIGNWSLKGDTIILNSNPHFSIRYVEDSSRDKIIIKVSENGDPNTFAFIFAGGKSYTTDFVGTLKLAKAGIDTIRIGYVSVPDVTIYLDQDKLKRVGVIEIDFDKGRQSDIFHVNEQWLFRDGRLYYPVRRDEESEDTTKFDKKYFFRRVNLKHLTCLPIGTLMEQNKKQQAEQK